MHIDQSTSEQILTLHSIRLLSQTAEALVFCLWNVTTGADMRDIGRHAEGCANRAKQIAINALDAQPEKTRMWYLVKDIEWLMQIIDLDQAALAKNKLHYPGTDDLQNLLDLVKRKAGIGPA